MNEPAFKPFSEMTPEDYAAVGFKSGLEIHQQLYTEKKLFCRCPAGKYSPKYHAEILRHMRPTLSELGEYDGTALMEFKTKKEIIYRINRETVCTYEMDDTPPFELNEEALDSALAIAMLYGCKLIDEIHIARKQYLDGSIPTGFQRTTIVGVDGKIPYKGRFIQIVQLGLEEDACREVSDIGHRRVYLTDRLGMPLIETVTAPEMKTPLEVAEVAQILRRLVRSTGRVRTGLGAGREDVNVSVTGGTRIEIKGVPRIPRIPLLTYNEAMRQWNLLLLRAELARRGVTPDTFSASDEDVTKILRKTSYQPIRSAIEAGMVARAVRLGGFKDLFRWQTQTGTVFSKEISDRVRVISCLTVLPNIIHSDSLSETILGHEWQAIRKALNAGENDTLVVVWGTESDTRDGVREIIIRAREATIGVPSETRQALADGTNGFERILPGADRMYPDTDLPPKRITVERMDRLRETLPTDLLAREAKYRELGVPEDLVFRLASSPFAPLFEQAVGEWKIASTLASMVLAQYPRRLKKRGFPSERLDETVMKAVLAAVRDGRLYKEGILPLLEKVITDGKAVEELLPAPAGKTDKKKIATRSREIAGGLKDRKFQAGNGRELMAMGLLMAEWRGRADGAELASLIRKELERTAE